ncbi:MAG: D-alanyl-D-alanine carboxypeptidase/D-alanyl-D-alanine-endopeptidase [Fidelibacterota bacterium]
MKFRKLILIFNLVILVILSGCSQTQISSGPMSPSELSVADQIQTLLSEPALAPATIGVYIEELGSGKIVYAQNEHKLLMPASNMKLVTTASALSVLGPDFRYNTDFYTNGKIEDGVLKGDLIIKGSGNPTIGGRFYGGKTDSVFTLWVEALHTLGIEKIQGNIIGDKSIFADDGVGYGWEKDDLPYYYAAKTGALSYNDNCIDLHISPAEKIGEPVKIQQKPIKDYLDIDNQMITVPKDSASGSQFYRDYALDKLLIKGKMPIDAETDVDWTTVPEPADFLLTAFAGTLEQNNIKFTDTKICSEKVNYEDKTLLFSHNSVSMQKIVHNINKISNNFYAETVLKTLSDEKEKTTATAVKEEKKFLSSIGIDTDRMFIVDGSGLSRHNMVTVNQIAGILKYMSISDNFQIFKESLPIGGVDGTLRYRLKGSNAKGHVFAKTGYVGHVRALSGYVDAKNGKTYVFSIIANHYPTPTSKINNLQDHIVTLLYNQEN